MLLPRVDWVFPPHSTQLSQEPTDKHTGELNVDHPSVTFSFWVIPQCVKVTKKISLFKYLLQYWSFSCIGELADIEISFQSKY